MFDGAFFDAVLFDVAPATISPTDANFVRVVFSGEAVWSESRSTLRGTINFGTPSDGYK